LPTRFARARQFVVGEIGFGSGLNFIATVETWLQTAATDARLHYIAVEKHPFTPHDLSIALSAWPSLAHITRELLEVYPPLVHGFHYRQLLNRRVSLTLLFGDALELLPELNATVDAWFLDGFSPEKNQRLWSDNLFQFIAERTVKHGSLATFTAAGDVRRRLQTAGFVITKRPGFGKKREMLSGRLDAAKEKKISAPWFHQSPFAASQNRQAIVIGAGIAGITTASALAQRGWHITLIEQHAEIANGASGNPAGLILPRLTADMSLAARYYLTAFLFTTRWLQQLQTQRGDVGWHGEGVIQLLDAVRQQALNNIALPESILQSLDAADMAMTGGTAMRQGGVSYPLAGWLQPQKLCEALLQQQPQIHLLASTDIQGMNHLNGEWQVRNASAIVAAAPVLVIANGSEAARLLPTMASGLQAVRGQLTFSQRREDELRCPVCYDGYVIPLGDGRICLGASYDRHSRDTTLREKDHRDNLYALQQVLPEFSGIPITGGRVAFRASTQDHLPLVGPVPRTGFYQQHYADLYHGRPAYKYPLAEYEPGLYINTGHGSRGLTSCPLAAEVIAAMINGEPLPVAEDIRLATHPARFMVRDLKRHLPEE